MRLVVPTVALLLASSFAAAADDWPQWRGPNRDGKSTETGLDWDWKNSPPELIYLSEGLGSGYAGVAIAKDKLFTTGNFSEGQAVVCVSAKDGKPVWKRVVTVGPPKHSYEGSRSTPTVDGDRVYAVTSDGQIVCVRADSGELVWKRNFRQDWNGRMMSGWGFSESPLVDGDWVLCTPGGKEAMIVALNKTTGREVWRSAVPDFGQGQKRKAGAGYSSIVVSHGAGVKQYLQIVGAGIISVRASDGKFLWGYTDIANRVANIPTPIPAGDMVFCSTGYGTGAALLRLRKDGDGVAYEEQYFLNAKTLENHHGGMVLHNGHIYCGHKHGNGFPICVDLESGKVIWGGDFRGPGKGSAAIVFADGHLIFRYQSGELAAIEATPKGYQLKGVLKPAYQKGRSWAHPVVLNGKLYLREQDKLMCYDLR